MIPKPARPAASVMLVSGGRVLLVRRSPKLKAFANLWAFPGGTVSRSDGESGDSRIVAAAREVFEETGVLLGRGGDPEISREPLRRALLAGEIGFAEALARLGATLPAADFVEVESLTTPEPAPHRFETRFYRLPLPEGERVSIWPGEIVDSALVSPEEALDRWRRGEMALAPPIIGLLERWSGDDDEFRERNQRARYHRPAIRYSPGVAVLSCRTPTLPPATHTNALLIGASRRYLIDPAPEDPGEREELFRMVDRLLGNDLLEAVLVTHHHRDHIGSVLAAAARYRVPVGAHPETFARMPAIPGRTIPLGDGDLLDLGQAPDGSPDWRLEVLFTPGHAPGHLVFVESRYGAMAVGDMVSSLSSILISPEDGDLGQYMDSLRRIARACRGMVYPAHGVPVVDGRKLLDAQIRHRETREAAVLEALGDEPAALSEIGRLVYPASEVPLDGPVRRLAESALMSGLRKLECEGKACAKEGRWSLAG